MFLKLWIPFLPNRDVSVENNLATTCNFEDPILQTEGRFYLIRKSRAHSHSKKTAKFEGTLCTLASRLLTKEPAIRDISIEM